MRTRWTPALALVFLAACGGADDPVTLTNEGSTALGASRYEDALASFDQALALMQPDHPQYVRAKLGAVEAQIYLDAETAKADFLQFAAASQDVGERDYRMIGSKMTSANKFTQAIEVLDAGIQKYGKTNELERLIEEVKKYATQAGDSGALDKLKGLGYI